MMGWSFAVTLLLWIGAIIIIMIMMMIGHTINAMIFPKCRAIMSDENVSFEEKQDYVNKMPKIAIFNSLFVHIVSCFIGCSIFASTAIIYANVDSDLLWLFQSVIMISFQLMEYMNSKNMPSPPWYKDYCIGYLSWMLSIIFSCSFITPVWLLMIYCYILIQTWRDYGTFCRKDISIGA